MRVVLAESAEGGIARPVLFFAGRGAAGYYDGRRAAGAVFVCVWAQGRPDCGVRWSSQPVCYSSRDVGSWPSRPLRRPGDYCNYCSAAPISVAAAFEWRRACMRTPDGRCNGGRGVRWCWGSCEGCAVNWCPALVLLDFPTMGTGAPRKPVLALASHPGRRELFFELHVLHIDRWVNGS